MDSLLLLAQNNDGDAAAAALAGGFVLLWLLCIGVSIVISIVGFVFWIWALVDVVKNQTLTDNERIMWVLIIIFLHGIGGIIYLLAGRRGTRMGP